MKTLTSFLSNKVEELRFWADTLAVFENPTAPLVARADAAKVIFVDEPSFWSGVVETAFPVTSAPTQPQVFAPVQPKPTIAPAKPQQQTAPARTLQPRNGDFAGKLGGAVAEFGLGPLAEFRKLMEEAGKGREYWDICRKITETVLVNNLLAEADWKLLTNKMKYNLFFSCGDTAAAFLKQCPKPVLVDLLVGERGLKEMVAGIKAETVVNSTSPYRLELILDMCEVAGKEAKDLLVNTKQAVNRLNQLGFLLKYKNGDDHLLVQKVAEMKLEKKASLNGLPAEEYALPTEVPASIVEPPATASDAVSVN